MSKKMTAVLFTVMICFAAGNASAMKGHDKGMMDCDKCMEGGEKGMRMDTKGMAGRFMMMTERLELNADQKKAVEAIHFSHHKEVIRKEADFDVAEIELQEIMSKEPVNTEEAEKQIRAIAAMHADLDVMHMKAKEAVKAKLTPEQVEKMKMHMAAGMGGKMAGMGDKGMADCKMDPKTKKCRMTKNDSGGAKAPRAAAAGKAARAEEKKAESSHQH